jgi:hypothetical protein
MRQFPQFLRDAYDKIPSEIDFRSLYNWAEENSIEVTDPYLNKKVPINKQLIGERYAKTMKQSKSPDVTSSIYRFLKSRRPNKRVENVLREMLADIIPSYLRVLPPILADEDEHIQTLYDELAQIRQFLLRNVISGFYMQRLETYNKKLEQLNFYLGIDPDREPFDIGLYDINLHDIELAIRTETLERIDDLEDEQILLMNENFDDYFNLRYDAWSFLLLYTDADHEQRAIILEKLDSIKKAIGANAPNSIDIEQIQLCKRIRDKPKPKISNINKVKESLRNKYRSCKTYPLGLFDIMLQMTTMDENDLNILIDFFHLGELENAPVKHLFDEIGKITNCTLPEDMELSIAIKEEATGD